jgi:hypothetical protein
MGWDTGDATEGIASFREKRKPSFPKRSPV